MNGSYYENAFTVALNTIWGATEFKEEIKNLSYYRTLSCMLRDSEVGETARRDLLKAYMEPNFGTETNDTLNILYPILPSDNSYVKRAVKNLCQVYNEKPNREIVGANEETLADIYNTIQFDYNLNKIHRILKLTNEIAITLRFINGIPKLHFITPDNYRLKLDDFGNPYEMWVPYTKIINKQPKQFYKVWTFDKYKILDDKLQQVKFNYNGKEFIEIPNPLGELPYSILSLDGDKDEQLEVYGGGLYELVKAQIQCNKLDFMVTENLDYNGFALWVMTNWDLKKSNIKLKPGAILVAEGINQNDGIYPPSVETASPQSQYLDIEDLKSIKMKKVLKNLGLPTSLVEDNPGLAQSGVALQIDRMELNELRKEDIIKLRTIEDELIRKITKILNNDIASPYKGKFKGDYYTEIDYIEPSIFLEPEKEFEHQRTLFEYGIISPSQFLNRVLSNDTITDDEEAIKKIKENRIMLNELRETDANTSGLNERIIPRSASAEAEGIDKADNGTAG